MTTALPSTIVDILILGGSHVGLFAALTLNRALHNTIIFDDHKPRNWQHFPLHLTPEESMELLASGLCRFLNASIRLVARLDNKLFQVTDSDNVRWNARRSS